ncbi:MAG: hypothetical protein Q9M43_02515 [Sulfurimonas sp.]|nr:hypothetical protein [Sulfurimonas sp.]
MKKVTDIVDKMQSDLSTVKGDRISGDELVEIEIVYCPKKNKQHFLNRYS